MNEDIPCQATANAAHGLTTERYTGQTDPDPIKFDDIVEHQQTDTFCKASKASIGENKAKKFFVDAQHALYQKTAHGDELVIPKSLRSRLFLLQHHSTMAALPGMKKMYCTMRTKFYSPSMVTVE